MEHPMAPITIQDGLETGPARDLEALLLRRQVRYFLTRKCPQLKPKRMVANAFTGHISGFGMKVDMGS